MILGIISAHNPAKQSIFLSISSQFPFQTINMNSPRNKLSRLCMLRGDPDRRIDQYYQKLIKHNPGNAMLLGNYARFLKEVRGDLTKAEEYCARAILTKDGDGNILALYGELTWQINNDVTRAEAYFHQAVLSHPEDSYILASYARFLWEADEKDADR